MHGTRTVQKLIEFLSDENQIQLMINALRNDVVLLIKDLNGNHVIQRCLHHLSSGQRQFIYDAVAGRCVEVATHRHGCCVLQRCIDYANESQRSQLLDEITTNSLELVQDPFGNYVVQYVLDWGQEDINQEIMATFAGHIFELSANKFSSNVIEKCLRLGPNRMRRQMVAELMDTEKLRLLLLDSFANYVIQTGLTVCDPDQFAILSSCIRPMLHLVRNTPYGKKIENKLNKRHLQKGIRPESIGPTRLAESFGEISISDMLVPDQSEDDGPFSKTEPLDMLALKK